VEVGAALGEVEETVFASLFRQQRSSSTTNCSFFPSLRQRCWPNANFHNAPLSPNMRKQI